MDDKDFKQRESQLEKLIRTKKVKQGLEEPEEAPVSDPVKPKSKWEHFWFYYKWRTIIIACIVLVAGYIAYDQITAPKFDYTILLVTSEYWSDNSLSALADQLEKFGEDCNGDGEVRVNVSNIVRNGEYGDSNAQQMSAKLSTEIAVGDNVIYITDKFNFKQMAGENLLVNLEKLYPDNDKVKDNRVLLTETAILDGVDFDLLSDKNLFVTLRVFSGIPNNTSEKVISSYDAQAELVYSIIKKAK